MSRSRPGVLALFMAVTLLLLGSFNLSLVDAKPAATGTSCSARSCKDGDCEDVRCHVLGASDNTVKASEGTIYSCTGWNLNRSMNAALKEYLNSGKHKDFQNLDIVWKQGHNPELHVKGGNKIDLNGKSEDDMIKLLREQGFRTHDEL